MGAKTWMIVYSNGNVPTAWNKTLDVKSEGNFEILKSLFPNDKYVEIENGSLEFTCPKRNIVRANRVRPIGSGLAFCGPIGSGLAFCARPFFAFLGRWQKTRPDPMCSAAHGCDGKTQARFPALNLVVSHTQGTA